MFAADMYATVFKGDPLDPARGQRYREKILLPGGSRDDIESLKVGVYPPLSCKGWANVCAQDFLGREPNSEAFIKELFGAVQSNL